MLIDIKQHQKIKITNSETVWKLLKGVLSMMDLFDREKEHLWVVGLNATNKIKYIDHVSMGSLKGTVAEPREIFRNAIHLGAANIIVAHNHPSGNNTPSERDIQLTKKITDAGVILGILLIDHIIVCEKGRYSFADEGLL